MPHVPVVMVIAAAVVLAAVVIVALGRGGELAFFQADYAPIRLGEISATDVVLFRPPLGLWGYNAQATDEALNRIADSLTERDIEIAALRQQVADLEAASQAARRRAYRNPDPPDRAGPPGSPDDSPPSGSRPQDLPPSGGAGPLPREAPPGFAGQRPTPRQPPVARDEERFGLGGAAAAGEQPPGEEDRR